MKTSNLSRLQVSDTVHAPPLENFASNDWLISIRDPNAGAAQIVLPIEKTLHIAFHDISSEFDGAITDQHAATIATFIKQARKAKVNLWVNCHAGVSRSGAIVELLSQLGWDIEESIRSRRRIPNALVFNKLKAHFKEDNIRDLKPMVEYLEDGPNILL